MKQKNLFLLVGPPAAGKSTFLAKTIPLMEDSRVISRDEIRFALVAEDEPYLLVKMKYSIVFLVKLENH